MFLTGHIGLKRTDRKSQLKMLKTCVDMLASGRPRAADAQGTARLTLLADGPLRAQAPPCSSSPRARAPCPAGAWPRARVASVGPAAVASERVPLAVGRARAAAVVASWRVCVRRAARRKQAGGHHRAAVVRRRPLWWWCARQDGRLQAGRLQRGGEGGRARGAGDAAGHGRPHAQRPGEPPQGRQGQARHPRAHRGTTATQPTNQPARQPARQAGRQRAAPLCSPAAHRRAWSASTSASARALCACCASLRCRAATPSRCARRRARCGLQPRARQAAAVAVVRTDTATTNSTTTSPTVALSAPRRAVRASGAGRRGVRLVVDGVVVAEAQRAAERVLQPLDRRGVSRVLVPHREHVLAVPAHTTATTTTTTTTTAAATPSASASSCSSEGSRRKTGGGLRGAAGVAAAVVVFVVVVVVVAAAAAAAAAAGDRWGGGGAHRTERTAPQRDSEYSSCSPTRAKSSSSQ
eukprot:scaffold6305_cov304-Prasinococcus_capsulatus_cf.AAC.2